MVFYEPGCLLFRRFLVLAHVEGQILPNAVSVGAQTLPSSDSVFDSLSGYIEAHFQPCLLYALIR